MAKSAKPLHLPSLYACFTPTSVLQPLSGINLGLGKMLTIPKAVAVYFSAIDGNLYPCPKEARKNVRSAA